MGMDLSKKCHHCGASPGELCHEDCGVNGSKITRLRKALSEVELQLGDIDPTRNRGAYHESPHCEIDVMRSRTGGTGDYNPGGFS